jgi:hypothetical protein
MQLTRLAACLTPHTYQGEKPRKCTAVNQGSEERAGIKPFHQQTLRSHRHDHQKGKNNKNRKNNQSCSTHPNHKLIQNSSIRNCAVEQATRSRSSQASKGEAGQAVIINQKQNLYISKLI